MHVAKERQLLSTLQLLHIELCTLQCCANLTPSESRQPSVGTCGSELDARLLIVTSCVVPTPRSDKASSACGTGRDHCIHRALTEQGCNSTVDLRDAWGNNQSRPVDLNHIAHPSKGMYIRHWSCVLTWGTIQPDGDTHFPNKLTTSDLSSLAHQQTNKTKKTWATTHLHTPARHLPPTSPPLLPTPQAHSTPYLHRLPLPFSPAPPLPPSSLHPLLPTSHHHEAQKADSTEVFPLGTQSCCGQRTGC